MQQAKELSYLCWHLVLWSELLYFEGERPKELKAIIVGTMNTWSLSAIAIFESGGKVNRIASYKPRTVSSELVRIDWLMDQKRAVQCLRNLLQFVCGSLRLYYIFDLLGLHSSEVNALRSETTLCNIGSYFENILASNIVLFETVDLRSCQTKNLELFLLHQLLIVEVFPGQIL